jgi:hypothetical protein
MSLDAPTTWVNVRPEGKLLLAAYLLLPHHDPWGDRQMSASAATADERRATETEDSVMQSVSDAMSHASKTATDHATKATKAVAAAGPKMMQSASRLTYTSAYFLAYAVVYPVVFVAKALPQENPVMKGFRDGGQAATDALNVHGHD